MEIDVATLPPREAYHWMVKCLIPRPIAWTSTLDADGRPNLAPFSFFGGVTSSPPTVMLSVGRRGGAAKDTAANLIARREAVVHIVTRPLAEAMVATSAEAAADVDEFELAGLDRVPAQRVAPWRVAGAAVAMEAEVAHHMEVGDGPVDLFLLRVVHLHVDDAVLREGLPDPALLEAVGRLGGADYCDTRRPFEIERPMA